MTQGYWYERPNVRIASVPNHAQTACEVRARPGRRCARQPAAWSKRRRICQPRHRGSWQVRGPPRDIRRSTSPRAITAWSGRRRARLTQIFDQSRVLLVELTAATRHPISSVTISGAGKPRRNQLRICIDRRPVHTEPRPAFFFSSGRFLSSPPTTDQISSHCALAAEVPASRPDTACRPRQLYQQRRCSC